MAEQSLLHRKPTPNRVNQMSERGIGHTEQSRGETIDDPREKNAKARIQRGPLGLPCGIGEFFVHSLQGEFLLPASSISPLTAKDRGTNSSAADANVFESHGPEPCGIQQILCVYDDGLLQ